MSSKNIAVGEQVAEEQAVSRRSFVKVAVGGMCVAYAAAIGYPVYRYLESPVEKEEILAAIKDVTLPGAEKLPKGSVMMFKFGPYPAMLIHHANDEWVAFSAVCTHLGCTVQYHTDTQKIQCACHGGQYDPHTGQNIAGPPPRPLTKFLVAVAKDSVTVSRA
jgi:cytochrome b6-f complex iron-sulfur subunit